MIISYNKFPWLDYGRVNIPASLRLFPQWFFLRNLGSRIYYSCQYANGQITPGSSIVSQTLAPLAVGLGGYGAIEEIHNRIWS